jgi:hypothetical protein
MPTVATSLVSSTNTAVEARGFNGMGPVMLYLAVKEYLKDRNAYDAGVPDKCNLYMETTDGANCRTTINCGPTDKNWVAFPTCKSVPKYAHFARLMDENRERVLPWRSPVLFPSRNR